MQTTIATTAAIGLLLLPLLLLLLLLLPQQQQQQLLLLLLLLPPPRSLTATKEDMTPLVISFRGADPWGVKPNDAFVMLVSPRNQTLKSHAPIESLQRWIAICLAK